ncbi:hypothetical protein [Pseudoalteromonas ardens]|uniref:Uncharacterized protein n=1 Tax=Pseudoalteromonas rubra TaxID=43658 RepID=A0A0L0EPK6_9GAMM|nr:hypothetical protein [Pseudoalteromonas sp. R96]KNC66326.1 hypothetical protein AC626_17705 [Pseudoalteromonas rubra]MDK1312793.1 hypothetical protein [Pseudoalteromonas sp. R96]
MNFNLNKKKLKHLSKDLGVLPSAMTINVAGGRYRDDDDDNDDLYTIEVSGCGPCITDGTCNTGACDRYTN